VPTSSAPSRRGGRGAAGREANLPRHLQHPGREKTADGEAAPDDSLNETADVTPPDVKEGELGHDPQLDRAFELLRSGQVVKTLAKRDE